MDIIIWKKISSICSLETEIEMETKTDGLKMGQNLSFFLENKKEEKINQIEIWTESNESSNKETE